MSIECGECERNVHQGHAKNCSRGKRIKKSISESTKRLQREAKEWQKIAASELSKSQLKKEKLAFIVLHVLNNNGLVEALDKAADEIAQQAYNLGFTDGQGDMAAVRVQGKALSDRQLKKQLKKR